jgi:hypothetical protein
MEPLLSIIIVAACLSGPPAIDIVEKVVLAPDDTPIVGIVKTEPECFPVNAPAPDHRHKYRMLARYDHKGASLSVHETPQSDGTTLYLVTLGPELPNV